MVTSPTGGPHRVSGLHMRLMGVPEVRLNDVPLTFSRRRALSLLVYLAISGQVHSRDMLATFLSGDVPESQARKRLSNALAELRQLVGDYVIATRTAASFNRDLPSSSDIEEFRAALSASMAEENVDQLQDPLALYHDDFLAGMAVGGAPDFDEWVRLQGDDLRTLAVQGLQRVVVRASRTRANADGIRAARRLLVLEPWMEETHRSLMILLARAGQHQEALAQYEICRSTLDRDLGEEPAPETTTLYNRLRRPPPPATNSLPVPRSPLVGREVELDLLLRRLTDPNCHLITLVGLGGSGKSRLALECARALAVSSASPEGPFPDGVHFISLPSVVPLLERDSDAVLRGTERIACAITEEVIGTVEPGTDAMDCLRNAMLSSASLVVLDGADGAVQTALEPVLDLLATCPDVRVLVTARRPLEVADEHVLSVHGLGVPSTSGEVDEAPASRLLLAEAQRADLRFMVREEDQSHVTEICRLLGGMPLALILAAPWLAKLYPADLELELNRGLDLLTTSDPRVADEHQSMLGVLNRSWIEFSSEEQGAIEHMSKFQNGFSGISVRDVPDRFMRAIGRLMERGVILQGEKGRYVVHEVLRRYATWGLVGPETEGMNIRPWRVMAGPTESESFQDGLQILQDAAS